MLRDPTFDQDLDDHCCGDIEDLRSNRKWALQPVRQVTD